MGLWGAAQASPSASAASPARSRPTSPASSSGSPAAAYATVFAGEAVLFLVAAGLAARVGAARDARDDSSPTAGARYAAGLGGR